MLRPTPTTTFVPKRSASRGASGAPTTMPSAGAASRRPAGEGVEAAHELQVLREEEDVAEQPEEGETQCDARGTEPPLAEELQGQHRVIGVSLPHHEGHEEHDARGPARRGPPPTLQSGSRGFDDAVEQARQRRRSTAPRPGTSTGGASGSREVGTKSRTQHDRDRRTMGTLTRRTEPHHQWSSSTPPRIGPSGNADARQRGPDPDRPAALPAFEHVRDDRERRREDRGAADAHQRAEGDEPRRGRERGQRRADAEDASGRRCSAPRRPNGRRGCRR